jgi:hypothetical protein
MALLLNNSSGTASWLSLREALAMMALQWRFSVADGSGITV